MDGCGGVVANTHVPVAAKRPNRGVSRDWPVVQSCIPRDVRTEIRVLLKLVSRINLRLYSENNDPAAIKQFSWIPNNILHSASISREVKLV